MPVMRPPFDALDKGAKRIARGPDGSELVPADMTYYEWLKTQPAAFQNDAIGPRRAELLRNGGLSAKRFSELNLGRNFQPLTLEEMKRVEPGAFERAGAIALTGGAGSSLKNNLLFGAESSIFNTGGDVDDFGGAVKTTEYRAALDGINNPSKIVESLKISADTALYEKDTTLSAPGYYDGDGITIKFNPLHRDFPTTEAGEFFLRTHELLHKADIDGGYWSWDNKSFVGAIEKAKKQVDGVFELVLRDAKDLTKEEGYAVHDILSALKRSMEGLDNGHSGEYYAEDERRVAFEIFANMGYLDVMKGKGMGVIQRYFTEIFKSYHGMLS